MTLNLLLWGVYAVFAALVFYFNWHQNIFVFDGAYGFIKAIVWASYLGFLVYSIHCSLKENIFKSVPKIAGFHWGRQIGLDLYLGLMLFLFIIYFHEGPYAVVLWLLPTLAFANLATLLYFAVHFESIVSRLAI